MIASHISTFLLLILFIGLHQFECFQDRINDIESFPAKKQRRLSKDDNLLIYTCGPLLSENDYEPEESLTFYRYSSSAIESSSPPFPLPLPKHYEESSTAPAKITLSRSYEINLIYIDKNMADITKDFIGRHAIKNFCTKRHQPYFNQANVTSNMVSISTIKITHTNGTIHSSLFAENDLVYQYDHETYQMIINEHGMVTINVNGPEGAKHALATLSQLLYSMPILHLPLEILDWPENHWRGVMIDVARHFQPIPLLKRCIDAMVASKLNILHLHLTDSQSFPILLSDNNTHHIPISKLAKLGSFGPDKMYTIEELQDLVQYGILRGIEIIPEIDFPAHTLAWGKAFPEIIIRCDKLARKQQTPHNIYLLNPAVPLTFQLIEEILQQLSTIFPSPYLHIGGDEVNAQCWSEDEQVMTWAKTQHLVEGNITSYFEQQILQLAEKVQKIPIVWQGVFDDANIPMRDTSSISLHHHPRHTQNAQHRHTRQQHPQQAAENNNNRVFHSRRLSDALNANEEEELVTNKEYTSVLYRVPSATTNSNGSSAGEIIVEPWKCWGGLALRTAKQAFHQAYPVYMSACWYLDYNSDWTTFLATNVLDTMETSIQEDLAQTAMIASRLQTNQSKNTAEVVVQHDNYFALSKSDSSLGGEGAMWTEHVDATNLECRMWPRMGIIAYRLWGLGTSLCKLGRSSSSGVANNDTTCISSSSSPYRAQEIQLSVLATKVLYASYVNYRYYLADMLHIHSAPIIAHYPILGTNNKASLSKPVRGSGGGGATRSGNINNNHRYSTVPLGFRPVIIHSRDHIFRLIDDISLGLTLTSKGARESNTLQTFQQQCLDQHLDTNASNNTNNNTIFWMSSQCLGIPETIQRPLYAQEMNVLQFNIADGSVGIRGEYMLEWLQQKAENGVMLIGLCELVGWQKVHSTTEIVKNIPLLALRGANAGFVYSHMTNITSTSQYPLGILSIYPFQIMQEYEAPYFQRGVLYVYFPNIQYHVFIIHLHAHSAIERLKEVEYLLQHRVNALLTNHCKVLIMGDFNTLSPYDHLQHHEDHIVDMLSHQQSNRHIEIMNRWKRKYLLPTFDKIDYRPMQVFLNAGLVDSCVESCCQRINQSSSLSGGTNCSREWSMSRKDDHFSQCMQQYCAGSEPTQYNPEWPADMDLVHPKIRLDFILMSPAVLQATSSLSSDTKNVKNTKKEHSHCVEEAIHTNQKLFGGVEINNYTDVMSDHYPVYAHWKDHSLSCPIHLF